MGSVHALQHVTKSKPARRLLTKRCVNRGEKVIELPRSAAAASAPTDADEVCGEELILKYRIKARKLGRSILRRWRARLDLQEVDSVVDLSLCEATVRFNPRKGASFMTFLYYHLRGNLIRAVTTAASSNTIPFASLEGGNQSSGNNDPERAFGSLSANALEVAEALSGQELMLPDEALLKKELLEISSKARGDLDPLEKEIIERLYLQEQQLMDIAHRLGYSRCHISRVKKKALETLHCSVAQELGIEANPSVVADDESLKGGHRKKVLRRKPRSRAAAASRATVQPIASRAA